MEWTDEGIVLGVRRHGESSAIVELLTREHGRHLGLVRGGAGTRMRPLLQPGNSVTAVWRARLDEHLGILRHRGHALRAATLLASAHATYGVTHLASLARLLPERDPHEDIYEMLDRTLDDFDDAGGAAAHLIRFELAMLAELGFGLDLENCAATGETADLIYVSPKSGGAVSRAAGEPYRDRLLRLPAFLREGEGGANGWSDQDLQDGFRLTGLFLLRHVLEPRGQGHSDAQGRVHQRGDAESGANQFRVVAFRGLSAGRPCERRDPYAAAYQFAPWPEPLFATNTCGYGSLRSQGRQLGCRLIRILPDSAEKFNASPWENDSYRRKNRPKSTRSCCAMRWKSAISPMRSRPSCTARCRTPATG